MFYTVPTSLYPCYPLYLGELKEITESEKWPKLMYLTGYTSLKTKQTSCQYAMKYMYNQILHNLYLIRTNFLQTQLSFLDLTFIKENKQLRLVTIDRNSDVSHGSVL